MKYLKYVITSLFLLAVGFTVYGQNMGGGINTINRLPAMKIQGGYVIPRVDGNIIGSVGFLGEFRRISVATTTPNPSMIAVYTTSSTAILVDSIDGFTGNLIDLKEASTSKFIITNEGTISSGTWNGNSIGLSYLDISNNWLKNTNGQLAPSTSIDVFMPANLYASSTLSVTGNIKAYANLDTNIATTTELISGVIDINGAGKSSVRGLLNIKQTDQTIDSGFVLQKSASANWYGMYINGSNNLVFAQNGDQIEFTPEGHIIAKSFTTPGKISATSTKTDSLQASTTLAVTGNAILHSQLKVVGNTYASSTLSVTGNILTQADSEANSFTIGANSLDTNEWAFLDGQDQALKIADSPTFVDLTLSGANLLSSGNINIKPSGDTDDYIVIKTVAGVPEITTAGNTNLVLSADSNGKVLVNDDFQVQTGNAEFDNIATWSGGANIGAVIQPIGDNAVDLGATGQRWANIWAGGSLKDDSNTETISNIITHPSNDGSDHTFIDQNVTTAGTPQFARMGLGVAADGSDQLAFVDNSVITHTGQLTYSLDTTWTETPGTLIEFTTDANLGLDGASGEQIFVEFTPEVNQSSTAGYTGFQIDINEDSVGSAVSRVMAFRVNGAAKFLVGTDGSGAFTSYVQGAEVRASSDLGGSAGTVSMTDTVTGKNTGGTTILYPNNTSSNVANAGWLKFYSGTTAYAMPMWTWASVQP